MAEGSDRDYRNIVEGCSGLLCHFQHDGRILFSNAAHAHLRKHSLADMQGANLWELMEPDAAADLRERLSSLTSEAPQLVFEEAIGPADGDVRWVFWTIRAVSFDQQGRVQASQSMGMDITERKRSELALAESEARLHLALQTAKAGVWTVDLETGEAGCSPELAPLYGYPPEMLPNYERWIARVHPDDRDPLQTGLDKYINSATGEYQQEFRIIHPELGIRWILDIGRVVRDSKGKPVSLYGINMDITDRHVVEDALRASESRFRHLAEAVPIPVWVTGEDDRFTYVNRSWTDYTGLSGETVESLTWFDLVHPDDHALLEELRDRLMEGGRVEGELRFRRSDGEYRWHSVKKVRITNDDGSFASCYGASLDVHEHRQLEQALRDSESMFRMIADTAPVKLWITDANGRCTFLSKGWYDFTGMNPEAALGLGWTETIHPDDRAQATRGFAWANETRSDYELDYRVRRFDGEYRWVLDRGQPRFGPRGEFLGHIGSIVDIHERTQAEVSLRESEERFRTLADNMSQLSWMADDEGRLIWFNRRWYEFTGSSEKRSVNWGWVKFLHPSHRRAVIKKIQHSWDTGEAWEDTFPLRDRNGEYHWFLSRALPIRDETGKITRWFGTHTDVTAQREAEEALREANRRKNEFLATLAHELRNPLAPLRNGLEIMQLAGTDAEAIKQARDMMQRQLDHMVRLIDDLLDLSRISRGRIRLHKRRVLLADVIGQAIEISRPKIEAQALDFYIKMPAEDCLVYADPTRLSQIFANLLNNSAKFTPPGGTVWLEVEIHDETATVVVRDNGLGIAPDLLPEVFEMFAQGERSLESPQGGLGVGLSLVKGLVELHGGTVTASSEGVGKGSMFTVQLPIMKEAAPTPSKKKVAPAGTRSGHHVLVVDDNPDSAASMATMLELLGNETRTAHDGVQALAEAATFRPDVILLDIGMPKLNGYEVARRIRQEEWGKDMTLVALTGWGQDEDRRRSREAGFDHHLVKPADLADVQDVLQGRTPKRRS